jgi:hypothetical protein
MFDIILVQQPPYPAISIGEFQQQALEAANGYRSLHSAPPLTLSSDLNNIAQNYAEKLAETKTFVHSGNTYDGNTLGECLWENTGASGPLYTAGKPSYDLDFLIRITFHVVRFGSSCKLV